MISNIINQVVNLKRSLKSQWYNADQIEAIQEKKLKKLVNHAYKNVNFYRKALDSHNIKPEDINSLDDIKQLPLLSKAMYRTIETNEIIAEGTDLRLCERYTTSGTTGTPLNIYFNSFDETIINLSWIRAFMASGMKPYHKTVAFIGKEKSLRQKSWFEYFGFFRRKEVSNWLTPDYWIDEIRSFKPDIIIGDVISLRLLADKVRDNYQDEISPKIIFNTSILLDTSSREYLNLVFNCKVFDLYGAFEGGCLAWECQECSGYHISSDIAIIEILKNGIPVAPGETGEVFLTNLHSFVMPFIRYNLGDEVRLSERSPVCGRNFPLIEQIIGRKDDYIVLRNGGKIACQPFYHILNSIHGIKKWRVIQEDLETLTVLIEKKPEFLKNSIYSIKNKINGLVGNSIKVNIKIVKQILHNPALKYRSVITKAGGVF